MNWDDFPDADPWGAFPDADGPATAVQKQPTASNLEGLRTAARARQEQKPSGQIIDFQKEGGPAFATQRQLVDQEYVGLLEEAKRTGDYSKADAFRKQLWAMEDAGQKLDDTRMIEGSAPAEFFQAQEAQAQMDSIRAQEQAFAAEHGDASFGQGMRLGQRRLGNALIRPVEAFGLVKEGTADQANRDTQMREAAMNEMDGSRRARTLRSAGSSIMQASAGAAAGVSLPLMFGSATANEAYTKAIDAGKEHGEAVKYALAQGGAEAATTYLFNVIGSKVPGLSGAGGLEQGFGRAAVQAAKDPKWRKLATSFVGENAEEVAQALASRGIDKAFGMRNDQPFMDELYDTLLTTSVTMGLVNTPAAISTAADAWARRNPEAAAKLAALPPNPSRKQMADAGVDVRGSSGAQREAGRQAVVQALAEGESTADLPEAAVTNEPAVTPEEQQAESLFKANPGFAAAIARKFHGGESVTSQDMDALGLPRGTQSTRDQFAKHVADIFSRDKSAGEASNGELNQSPPQPNITGEQPSNEAQATVPPTDQAAVEAAPKVDAEIDGVRKRYKEASGHDLNNLVEPTADHADAVEFYQSRNKKVRFFDADPKQNSFWDRDTDTVYLNARHKGDAMWYLVGHEYAHSSGADKRLADLPASVIAKAKAEYLATSNPTYRKQLRENPERLTREAVATFIGNVMRDPKRRAQLQKGQPTLWQKIVEAVKSIFAGDESRAAQRVLTELGVTKPAATTNASQYAQAKRGTTAEVRQFEAEMGAQRRTAPRDTPTMEQRRESGNKALESDYEGTYQAIVNAGYDGKAITPELTAAYGKLLDSEYARSRKSGDMSRVVALQRAYTMAGTAASQALSSRRDALNEPESRRRAVIEAINDPGQRFQEELKAAEEAYRKARQDFFKEGGTEQDLSDGPMLSNAVASPPTKTDTPEFKRWFGKSVVVNLKRGTPRVMYHGTSSSGFDQFETYGTNYGLMGIGAYFTADPEVASSYTNKGRGNSKGVYPVYLSIQNPIDMDAPADVGKWSDNYLFKEYGPSVDAARGMTNEQVFREIEQAMTEDGGIPADEGADMVQEAFRAMGYDGITHIGGGRVDAKGVRHRVYIAFDPTQIKSATGNRGTFDPNEPSILLANTPDTPGRKRARRKLTEAQKRLDMVHDRIAKVNNRVQEQLKKLGYDLDKPESISDDPKQFVKFLRDVQAKRGPYSDVMYEYYRSWGLMSSLSSQAANIVGPWVDMVTSSAHYLGEAILNSATGNKTGATLGEMRYLMRGGLISLFKEARANAAASFRNELSEFRLKHGGEEELREYGEGAAASGTLGRINRLWFDVNLTADDFAKSIRGGTVVGALAYRKGKADGLSGAELESFINEEVNDPTSDSWKEAVQAANAGTLSDKGGKLSAQLSKWANDARQFEMGGMTPLRWLIPYVHTPLRAFARGLERSYLDTPGLLIQVAGNIYNRRHPLHNAGNRVARQTMAWGMMAMLIPAVGDSDDEDVWITGADDKHPYSVKLWGTWYSYARIDPFATTLGATADAIQGYKKDGAVGLLMAPLVTLFKMTQEKTMMQTFGDLARMAEASKKEGWRGAGRQVVDTAANFTAGWVPNIIRSTIKASETEKPDNQSIGSVRSLSDLGNRFVERTLNKMEVPELLGYGSDQPQVGLFGEERSQMLMDRPATDFIFRLIAPTTGGPADVHPGYRYIYEWNKVAEEKDGKPIGDSGMDPYVTIRGKKVWLTRDEFTQMQKRAGSTLKTLYDSNKSEFDPKNTTPEGARLLSKLIDRSKERARREVMAAKVEAQPQLLSAGKN